MPVAVLVYYITQEFGGGGQWRTLNGHISITRDCMKSALSLHRLLCFFFFFSKSVPIPDTLTFKPNIYAVCVVFNFFESVPYS